METKINIAAILKDKPQGTKLYNLLYNTDVELETIVTTGTKTIVWCTDKIDNNEVSHRFYSEFGTIEGYPEGLQILLPSKEMRDWAKFSWKKGDVLANGEGDYCVFKEFAHSSYQTVKAVFVKRNKESIHSDSCLLDTKDWHKASHSCTATYINTIEKELSGKLNMETLEIEKAQPVFKDGDIVFMKGIKGGYYANCIFILKSEYKDGDERAFYYAFYNTDDKFTIAEYGNTRVHYSLRPATDSEKQQLFDALAKKGKAWDAEKKQIVDLKPKCEFKPFDKVLGRNEKDAVWEAELFSHYKEESQYPFCCIGFSRKYCIPYNKETAHLLGTTDDWEGGEQ
jgi:hypothetical protein